MSDQEEQVEPRELIEEIVNDENPQEEVKDEPLETAQE